MAKKKKVKPPLQPKPKLSSKSINVTIEGFKPPLWWSEEYGLDFEVIECLNYDYYQTIESLERTCEYGQINKKECKII